MLQGAAASVLTALVTFGVLARADAEELLDSIGRPRAAARPLVESYLRGWPTDILVGTK